MENSRIIEESKALIKKYLDEYCSSVTSPYVCGLVSTKEGYHQVEQFVLQRMARNGDTVAQAIMLKERILDPNRLDD